MVALLKDGELVALGAAWEVLTEATIGEVFDHPVRILPHPDCDRPLLVAAHR